MPNPFGHGRRPGTSHDIVSLHVHYSKVADILLKRNATINIWIGLNKLPLILKDSNTDWIIKSNKKHLLYNNSLPNELTLEAWVVRITDWPEWPDEEEFGHQDYSPYWPNPKDKANWERAEYDYNITRSKFAARLELVRVALVTLGFIVERNDESSAFKDEDSLIVHVIFQNDLRHKFYYLLRSISGRTMVVDEHYDAYPEGTDVPAPLPLSELARCAVSLDHPETYLKCPDDLIPQKNEAPREWAMRIAFNSERLRNVSRLLETAGGNL